MKTSFHPFSLTYAIQEKFIAWQVNATLNFTWKTDIAIRVISVFRTNLAWNSCTRQAMKFSIKLPKWKHVTSVLLHIIIIVQQHASTLITFILLQGFTLECSLHIAGKFCIHFSSSADAAFEKEQSFFICVIRKSATPRCIMLIPKINATVGVALYSLTQPLTFIDQLNIWMDLEAETLSKSSYLHFFMYSIIRLW